MMLTAYTPTRLKQNERLVLEFHLPAQVCYNYKVSSFCNTHVYVLLLIQEDCSACSQVPLDLHFSPTSKLQELLDFLTESASL